MSKKNKRGSYYLEALLAIGILGIISTSLLPLLPQLLAASAKTRLRAKLVMIAEYSGEYLYNWVNVSPQNKHKSLASFINGEGLVTSNCVNQLPWADQAGLENLSPHYKTSFTFWEKDSRENSAVVRVLVWYDENLDNLCNTSETAFAFSTIISEKKE